MEDLIGILKFDQRELIPAIVQDAEDGEVLMLAYMNREAVEKTIKTGYSHFFSRSKNRIWMKGEESGNVQEVKGIYYDCDCDAILLKVKQHGVCCHEGYGSCFFRKWEEGRSSTILERQKEPEEMYRSGILRAIYDVIMNRKTHPNKDSYVSQLMEKGLDGILKKIIEEAGEVCISAKNGGSEDIIYEIADLWFHLLVLMGYYEIRPDDIFKELGRRFGKSGLRKKGN